MARARTLLLVLAMLIGAADVVSLGVHDFDDNTGGGDGLASTVSSDTTTATTSLGTEFTGEKRNYTMRVDPAWPHQSDVPFDGFEVWQVADFHDGFRPNVGVLVENLPDNLTIEEYLHASAANLPTLMANSTITGSRIVEGAFRQRLGVIEYQATLDGTAVQFLAVFGVHERHAVVATLTVNAARFAEVRAVVEPYLLTLRAI